MVFKKSVGAQEKELRAALGKGSVVARYRVLGEGEEVALMYNAAVEIQGKTCHGDSPEVEPNEAAAPPAPIFPKHVCRHSFRTDMAKGATNAMLVALTCNELHERNRDCYL